MTASKMLRCAQHDKIGSLQKFRLESSCDSIAGMKSRSFFGRARLGGEDVDTLCRFHSPDTHGQRSMHVQHRVHHVLYRIICCPKRRRQVLVGPVHGRLKQVIEQVKTGSSANCQAGYPASSLLYFRF
jgi:hypothetical protein